VRIIIGCNKSGKEALALLAKGHDVYTCDILPAEWEHNGRHIQDDLLRHLNDGWDMGIFNPDCTYLSFVGVRHWNKLGRKEKRLAAFAFFMKCINAPIEKICVENPVGYPNVAYRKPDQIIHPYYFGEPVQKRTCLWLKNLPLLVYSDTIIEKPKPLYYLRTSGKAINWVEGIKGVGNRSQARSVSFNSIANAMANQWGNEIESDIEL